MHNLRNDFDRDRLRDALLAKSQRKASLKRESSDQVMKISIFFFSAEESVRDAADTYSLVIKAAQIAEDAGLHALWVPERHFDPFGGPFSDPAILLSAIGASTKTLQLRAGSVVLPLHDPVLVAERWAMVQELTQGRVGVSFATGWNKRDFVLNPDGYENRRQLTYDGIEEMRSLWGGNSRRKVGPNSVTYDVRTFPSVVKNIPIWVTASKNLQTWDKVHEIDSNILTAVLEQEMSQVMRLSSAARVAGYQGEITLMLHAGLDADPLRALEVARVPLRNYLSQHLSMFTAGGLPEGINPSHVTEGDRQALLDHGVSKYMTAHGLFGSAESVEARVRQLHDAGVSEVACLVDFGGSEDDIIGSIQELGVLVERIQGNAE